MTIARSVAEVIAEHVTLHLECIDRMYLNLYIPMLQTPEGVAWFWRHHRGYQFASSALMAPMGQAFVDRIKRFAQHEGVELVGFRKGQRKDDIAQERLRHFARDEGRLLRPGLALLDARDPPQPAALRRAILNLDQAIDRLWRDAA